MQNCVLIFLLLSCASCSLDVKKLEGHWQASAFFENGQSANTSLEDVSIDFYPSGRYSFRSKAHYSEFGTFRSSGHHLYLIDTTIAAPNVRKIKVLYLSDDSLKIEMAKSGHSQILFLYHQPQAPN